VLDAIAASTVPIQRLTQCVPGWERRAAHAPRVVGVLPGEGIGPEVVDAALVVLDAVTEASGSRFEVRRIGAIDAGADEENRLARACAEFCQSIFAAGGALLCGPMGGRFVYDLRARFDLYCKLVPLRPSPALADAAIIRPERLTGVDVLIVRENVGGLYFGESGRREGGRVAYQHFSYRADQVVRIVGVAARLARMRRGRLSVVVKAGGVPHVSALWSEEAEAVASDHGIAVEILEVDNASFQLVADPRRFDVVVAPNLFGDILADVAAVLLGSRGMSYSANFGPEGRAVYQTGHGAAHDLAGSNRANPVAQILSLAMMLRESFGLAREALWIETAVERVLAGGLRSQDIAGPGSRIAGTRQLAECIAREAVRLAGERTEAA
jgi:3-isopropylmalate dehydrogenase